MRTFRVCFHTACFTELFQNFWRIYISRISNDVNIQASLRSPIMGVLLLCGHKGEVLKDL